MMTTAQQHPTNSNDNGPLPAVLFDAPQIPAGMLEFRRIPLDSTGMEPESTGIGPDSCRNSTGIQSFFSLYKVIF